MLRSVYLGSAVVPDGYNGHTCRLHYVYVPADRLTYAIHASGHYRVSYAEHSIEEAPDIIRRRYPNALQMSLIGTEGRSPDAQ